MFWSMVEDEKLLFAGSSLNTAASSANVGVSSKNNTVQIVMITLLIVVGAERQKQPMTPRDQGLALT